MQTDAGFELKSLRVDGGMTTNELLMQFQSDILNVPVIRPQVRETTALGAAYAAGLAVGFWRDTGDVIRNWREERRWLPTMPAAERARLYRRWQQAVTRSLDWLET
jgi:glycerol kinase